MSLYVERLNRGHDRSRFNCGVAVLDEWFRTLAGQAEFRRSSPRVFVLVDDEIEDGLLPLGYYALLAHAVQFEDLPESLARDLPPHYAVGAALLARLAIDRSQQGRGLGVRLLADVMRTVLAANEHIATPLLVVDALDESTASFYLRFGFQPIPGQSLRLAARIRDLRVAFEGRSE